MEGFDIEVYMQKIKQELLNTFGDELVYLGLQGSFRRGEARESSDIDVMVILEEFTVERMTEYREILKRVGNFNKSCGFICGRKEMKNWNRFEICQLLHETKDYYGTLSQLVPAYSRQDVQDYLKTGAGNLYHELCHRYIHAPDTLQEVLPFLYKGTFYLLQNRHWLNTGEYLQDGTELLTCLSGLDETVLQIGIKMREGISCKQEEAFEALFLWCREILWEETQYETLCR